MEHTDPLFRNLEILPLKMNTLFKNCELYLTEVGMKQT